MEYYYSSISKNINLENLKVFFEENNVAKFLSISTLFLHYARNLLIPLSFSFSFKNFHKFLTPFSLQLLIVSGWNSIVLPRLKIFFMKKSYKNPFPSMFIILLSPSRHTQEICKWSIDFRWCTTTSRAYNERCIGERASTVLINRRESNEKHVSPSIRPSWRTSRDVISLS